MMSDDMLSQEEIEALLSGSVPTPSAEPAAESELEVNDYLDDFAQDTLGEIGNISFGSSATALSGLLGQKVDITTPSLSIINRDNLQDEFPHPYVAIGVEYTTGLSGINVLVIKQSDAAIIADLMLGGDGLNPNEDLGEIQLSAVQEAMNQMMGSAATSMSTVFNKKVDISPPTIDLLDVENDEGTDSLPSTDILVRISFRLKIGSLIDSEIMQLLPLDFAKKLVDQLMAGSATEPEPGPPAAPSSVQPPRYREEPVSAQQRPETKSEPTPLPPRSEQPPVQVQQAQFASFEAPSLSSGESRNLNMLLDIPLSVTVELGRTKRSVKEILEMTGGSIIELDKLAGEPVDILVNNRHIAKGEVVVIDENFGVRITEILSQADRLTNLR